VAPSFTLSLEEDPQRWAQSDSSAFQTYSITLLTLTFITHLILAGSQATGLDGRVVRLGIGCKGIQKTWQFF
jgi:hypothetical protein